MMPTFNGLPALFCDPLYYHIRAGPAAGIVHYHRSAFRCQVLCDGSFDALRNSRHDRDLTA